jgi:hypothetical protein
MLCQKEKSISAVAAKLIRLLTGRLKFTNEERHLQVEFELLFIIDLPLSISW